MEYGFSIRDRIENGIPIHLIQAMGGNWVRLKIRWANTEYRYTDVTFNNHQDYRYDKIVECCRDLGINILGVLDDVPDWALSTDYVFPTGTRYWGRFVRRIVRRYRDTIKHWMLWENINHNVPLIKTSKYIEDIFQPGVEAIWSQDLTAKIVAPDLDISKVGWTDWLRRFISHGYAIDYLGIRMYAPTIKKLRRIIEYGQGNRFTNPFRKVFDLESRSLHEILEYYHLDDTPIWLTHTGWGICDVSDRDQMKLYQQMIEYLESGDSPFKLTIFDSLVDGFYDTNQYGIFNAHYRPKASSLWMIQRMDKSYEPYRKC